MKSIHVKVADKTWKTYDAEQWLGVATYYASQDPADPFWAMRRDNIAELIAIIDATDGATDVFCYSGANDRWIPIKLPEAAVGKK